MTRDTAKHHAWSDLHGDLDPDRVPLENLLWARGFDSGWSAAIRAVAAALSDQGEFDRLIEEDAA